MKVRFDSPSGVVDLDDGLLRPFRELLSGDASAPAVRRVYAAAHLCLTDAYTSVPHTLQVAVDPKELAGFIDWQATLALRVKLDSQGFGIAEAMDTAQRFQIGWHNAAELIRRTGALELQNGFTAGAGVDHLPRVESERQLVDGVVFQARAIQAAGGIPILLPMLWLPEVKATEDDYVRVYGQIIDALDGPLFVHWLGEMFMASLAGYFPGDSFLRIMAHDPSKVRGAKLSLLDAALERRLRTRLADSDQIMLTGDDFHFGDLMAGPPATGLTQIGGCEVATGDFSHGLLGIFDGVAEPAQLALAFLARGNLETYQALMEPCEALGKHLFQAPTQHYKAGLAFLSWLNGAQPNRMLVQHEERARSAEHYLEAARLASVAGIIVDANAACVRLAQFFSETDG
jgi:hypothetical protein